MVLTIRPAERTRAPGRAQNRFAQYAPPSLLALFLLAGTLKGTPVLAWFPLDLTAVLAVALVVVVAHRLLRPGALVPASLGLVLLLFLAFVPGIVGALGTPAGDEKVLYLFTLTLLVAIAAIVVLNGERPIAIFAGALVVLGVVVAASALAFPDPAALASEKVAAEGSTTISAGRAVGAAALICLAAASARRIPVWLGAGTAVLFVTAMLLTGSRGPVLAVIVAAAVVFVLRPAAVARTTRLVRYSAVVAAALLVTLTVAGSQFAVQRAVPLLGSNPQGSTEVRLRLFSETLALIARNPLGIGWAQLGTYLSAPARIAPGTVQYSHNAVLEVTVEAGWLAGLAFVVVVVVGLSALLRATRSFGGSVMCTLAVFFLVNAMVSGTVNDNRFVFAALAVGLALRCGDMKVGAVDQDDASRAPARALGTTRAHVDGGRPLGRGSSPS